ncbi:hypothetical protein PAXINDRAFT_100910 [Paxillus involutus ATCC 200175]|uniref:Uncharacterized protein n=1 Tax=Paxillus involutus ATCC 200175 TaxID=664439 RepID=A0A0C9U0T5_PAXIN|nr:hypothetical protein PAXINDRAFT_100910 [Paxillus involutus ATCC 200175]
MRWVFRKNVFYLMNNGVVTGGVGTREYLLNRLRISGASNTDFHFKDNYTEALPIGTDPFGLMAHGLEPI